MAQNAFAAFFMLVFASCGIALFLSLAQDWQRIVSALTDAPPAPRAAPAYRTSYRSPAEVPLVAQRLVLRSEDAELSRRPIPPRIRSHGDRRRAQLSFEFSRSLAA